MPVVVQNGFTWYYFPVALRKTNKKPEPPMSRAVVFFWLFFFIIIIGIFLYNRDIIKENYNLLKTRLSGSTERENDIPPVVDEDVVVSVKPPAPAGEQPKPQTQENPPAEKTVTVRPEQEKPVVQEKQEPVKPAQTRDRSIYFTQIDKDGQILRSRVNRKITVSDSPMVDAINVMLTGPSADEIKRGIITLIPQNTRLLSAAVRGSTAYINFSEDFQFNTFGVEGYAAQLRQIVWTVTEFPTVKDVQILIEGRRIDYLGEGIWIGSPVDRQSL
jgi:spore germination protein GerM